MVLMKNRISRFKRPLAWALVCYLAGLIVFAPASWLDVVIRRVMKDRIELANANGTVWRGSGDLIATGKSALIGRYEWSFKPQGILKGMLQVDLRSSSGTSVLALGIDGISIDVLSLGIPIESLGGIVPEIGRYVFQGKADLKVENLKWSPKYFSGKFTCEGSNIASPIARVSPLGSYRLEVNGTGESAAIMLMTHPGSALMIEGSGAIKSGIAAFQGAMSASPAHKEILAPFLATIGGGNEGIVPLKL